MIFRTRTNIWLTYYLHIFGWIILCLFLTENRQISVWVTNWNFLPTPWCSLSRVSLNSFTPIWLGVWPLDSSKPEIRLCQCRGPVWTLDKTLASKPSQSCLERFLQCDHVCNTLGTCLVCGRQAKRLLSYNDTSASFLYTFHPNSWAVMCVPDVLTSRCYLKSSLN